MRLLFSLACLTALYACGQTPAKKAAFSLQNPNFIEGLTGWDFSGNVKVVTVQDLPGYSEAVMLTYDGTTPATLSQEIIVSRDTWMAVFQQQAGPAQGMLMMSFAQNGNAPDGGGGAGGDPNWQGGGLAGSVQAGTVKVTWTVGSAGLQPDSTSSAPAGTAAWLTGLVVDPNAPEPGPT